MKIIKIEEIGQDLSEIQILPESAIVRRGTPFFIPDWCEEWRFNLWLGVRIDRLGKSVHRKFAHRYWSQPILFMQAVPAMHCNVNCPGFDGSLMMCNINVSSMPVLRIEPLYLPNNEETVLWQQSIEMEESQDLIDASIEAASRYYTLHTGDLIMSRYLASLDCIVKADTRITVVDGDTVILNHKIK